MHRCMRSVSLIMAIIPNIGGSNVMPDKDNTNLSFASFISPARPWSSAEGGQWLTVPAVLCLNRRELGPSCRQGVKVTWSKERPLARDAQNSKRWCQRSGKLGGHLCQSTESSSFAFVHLPRLNVPSDSHQEFFGRKKMLGSIDHRWTASKHAHLV